MKLKSKKHPFLGYIPTIIIFILAVLILVFAVANVSNTSDSEGLAITSNTPHYVVYLVQ